MNIDYKNPLVVQITKHFYGTTNDGRKFLIQAIWTKNGWTIDVIIWYNNDGDKQSESEIKAEFLYEMANYN